METYFLTAARKSELYRLKWKEVDFENKRLGLWTRKRQNGNLELTWIDMLDSLGKDLGWLKSVSDSDFVFINGEGDKPFVDRRR